MEQNRTMQNVLNKMPPRESTLIEEITRAEKVHLEHTHERKTEVLTWRTKKQSFMQK